MEKFDSNGAEADERHKTAAEPCLSVPVFKFNLPNRGQRGYGTIMVGHEVLHIISDIDEFYTAIGYDWHARVNRMVADEFIWERYTGARAKMSPPCLQQQISVYLYQHSARFVELYGLAYQALIGNCRLSVVDKDDGHCSSCQFHPGRDGDQQHAAPVAAPGSALPPPHPL